jgi:RHS repeat-associated protein
VATFEYDALGRRIEKVDSIVGTIRRFYYDDQRIFLQTNVSGGTETYYSCYIYGNYIDEVLMQYYWTGNGWEYKYYAHDHLYSPTALFESDGDVVERYEYDVYGSCRILTSGYSLLSSSAYGNPYTFTGRELDIFDNNAFRIMYYRARSYDPQTGRFLQRDPLGVNPAGGKNNTFDIHRQYLDGLSMYEYVKSVPTFGLDPFGLVNMHSSCNKCGSPFHNTPKEREKMQKIIQSAENSCAQVDQKISDPKLAACIKKKCKNSSVHCSTAKPDGIGGNSLRMGGIDIYPNNYGSDASYGKKCSAGDVFIHEFAEDCDWSHNDGKGVPNPGYDLGDENSCWKIF